MAVINFDSSQVAPSTGTADALPAGWYNVMMDESDVKPTSKSTPDNPQFMLACRFNILDGQYAGRKVFTRLNIRNSNPQAVEIAYKDLSAICHAVGMVGMVQDSTMLHGKPLKIKVKLRAATGEYEASNEISAYKNINEQVGGAPSGASIVVPGAGVTPPPQIGGWQQPPAAPAGYAPQQGYAPPAGAPQAYGQPAPTGQPGYAPQQPAQQPAQPAWAPPAGQQPWASGSPQVQQAPAQPPQYQPPAGAPQGQPQGNPNPMAGQPPPWQQ